MCTEYEKEINTLIYAESYMIVLDGNENELQKSKQALHKTKINIIIKYQNGNRAFCGKYPLALQRKSHIFVSLDVIYHLYMAKILTKLHKLQSVCAAVKEIF